MTRWHDLWKHAWGDPETMRMSPQEIEDVVMAEIEDEIDAAVAAKMERRATEAATERQGPQRVEIRHKETGEVIHTVMFTPILATAKLEGLDLRGADLSCQSLRNTSFRGSDLRGADLSWSYVAGADFRGCRLEGVRWFLTSGVSQARFDEGVKPY